MRGRVTRIHRASGGCAVQQITSRTTEHNVLARSAVARLNRNWHVRRSRTPFRKPAACRTSDRRSAMKTPSDTVCPRQSRGTDARCSASSAPRRCCALRSRLGPVVQRSARTTRVHGSPAARVADGNLPLPPRQGLAVHRSVVAAGALWQSLRSGRVRSLPASHRCKVSSSFMCFARRFSRHRSNRARSTSCRAGGANVLRGLVARYSKQRLFSARVRVRIACCRV